MFERNSSVEYRQIPEFPGYEVGSDGSVWSYWIRGVLAGRKWKQNPIALRQRTESGQRGPREFRKPYKTVALTKDGCLHQRGVHRLVLEAFVGPCPDGMETRHLDTNPANNNLGNLAWGTKLENGEDKRIAGNAKGHRNGRAKLTPENVIEIRRMRAEGMTYQSIADNFGVSYGLIGFIIRGVNWTHVAS